MIDGKLSPILTRTWTAIARIVLCINIRTGYIYHRSSSVVKINIIVTFRSLANPLNGLKTNVRRLAGIPRGVTLLVEVVEY